MKKWKLFTAAMAFSLFLVSCKGSKCDCPSFKPKSQVEMDAPIHAKAKAI